MSIVTRDFINSNIEYYDSVSNRNYDFFELSKEIDFFKNIIQSHLSDNLFKKSILIGIQPKKQQTACIFACFELGVSICIIDYTRPDKFKQYNYVDPKTELLLPIDLFIVLTRTDTDKFDYFSKVCSKTVVITEVENLDYSKNKNIFANRDTVIMRCTSSGTTNTPKIVEHTHEFIYNLSVRNSKFFDGNVEIRYNLNHGSSFATFFLPALHSKNVKKIYNTAQQFLSAKDFDYKKEINHTLIPYDNHILEFLDNTSMPNTIIYTLSSISEKYLKHFEEKKLKDMISFFGCNETSGPTLLNQLSRKDFKNNKYYKVDDFYDLFIKEAELHVSLPYYENKVINTKDRFITDGNDLYTFHGRNDLIKINGMNIQNQKYSNVVSFFNFKNFHLIYDIFENKIYLAFEDYSGDIDDALFKIRKHIGRISHQRHTIDKFAKLDLSEFMTGVKLDQELLRHFFRKNVK